MIEAELKQDLTPEEERLAEAHLCRKWGEPPTTEELRPNDSARPGLQEELDLVDAALKAAYQAVPQNDELAARVLKALPPAVERPSVPVPATVTAMYVVSRRSAGRRWIWGVVGAAAALLFLAACLWWPALRRTNVGPTLQVAKGRVVDAAGRTVSDLRPGQTYQVSDQDAVVRLSEESAVRLLRESRFEVPETQESGLTLREGWAYARSPETTGVRIESDELSADIQGVSLVIQVNPESVEPGEGMVLVFKGGARIRPSSGDRYVDLNEGQMFTVSLGAQMVEPFLERADVAVKTLEQIKDDPAQLRAWHKQYAEVVAGYRRELASLKSELAATKNSDRRVELERRCALVKQYLKQHEERLESLPDLGENETPKVRAGRVRRAAERLERGRKEFSDPHQWM